MLGRVGVRMYIDVGPGGEPPSDFKIERLYPTRARDGRGRFAPGSTTRGPRPGHQRGTLLFDGSAGLRAGPFSAKTGTTLAPGDLAEAVVPLDARLPDGPWTAKLTLKSGLVEHTTRATITFPTTPGSAGAVAASVAQQGHFPTPVVAGLSALVLTALCLLLSTFLRRRR